MERFLIHKINVFQLRQKEAFQIRLPRDCKRLTGVKVTCDFSADDYKQSEVGWLWLSIPRIREAFYSEAVKGHYPQYDWAGYSNIMPMNFRDGEYWTGGQKDSFFSQNVQANQTLIEGYYSNEFATGEHYTVSIYLRIEV